MIETHWTCGVWTRRRTPTHRNHSHSSLTSYNDCILNEIVLFYFQWLSFNFRSLVDSSFTYIYTKTQWISHLTWWIIGRKRQKLSHCLIFFKRIIKRMHKGINCVYKFLKYEHFNVLKSYWESFLADIHMTYKCTECKKYEKLCDKCS